MRRDAASGKEALYEVARKACRVSEICMLVLTTLCALACAFVVVVAWSDLADGAMHFAYWAVSIATFALNIGVTMLLATFFGNFAKSSSPFGRAQSRRLLMAAVFEAVVIVLGLLHPQGPDASITLGGLPFALNYYPSEASSSVDIGHVVEVVFLFCLSAVFRYGNALKEDSDSIL
ncbi:MAG: hypothetical protein ACI360_00285 [Atopobiaceae bacterium]